MTTVLSMPSAERAAWVRLSSTPGLSPGAVRTLLATFGLPQQVLAASRAARVACVGAEGAALLDGPPLPPVAEAIAASEAWLAASPRHHLVTLADPAYPPALFALADPPPLLYVDGRPDLLASESVAIVGSRSATRQGLDHAEAFALHLCSAGLTIVSGLALGIDGAAHRGALAALRGRGGSCEGTDAPVGLASTVAVIGTGIDVAYPARHASLADAIRAEGAVVSELPLGAPALAHHFPRRNRLIAALARGTLVVEAAVHSGSLITARLAAELGREVFALPGSIHSPLARGCHRLIRDGARLVETADEVLADLAWGRTALPARGAVAGDATPSSERATVDLPAALAEVWHALGDDPVVLDALVERTGRPAGDLMAALLELELVRRAERLPGNRYQRLP